jgi:hypothetical protein
MEKIISISHIQIAKEAFLTKRSGEELASLVRYSWLKKMIILPIEM